MRLDLHGTKHEDVRRKVIKFVEKYWGTHDDVEIITGHSSRMKNLVIDVLDEYELIYTTGSSLDTDAPKLVIWGLD